MVATYNVGRAAYEFDGCRESLLSSLYQLASSSNVRRMFQEHDRFLVRNISDVLHYAGSELVITDFVHVNQWLQILGDWNCSAKQEIMDLKLLPESIFISKVDKLSLSYENTSAAVSFLSILSQFNELKRDIRDYSDILHVDLPSPNDLEVSYDSCDSDFES